MKRWVVWTVFIVAWTVALEMPVPSTENLPIGELILVDRFFFAKSVHVSAYAVLTLLSAWVRLAQRHRVIMMFVLMGHATATELMQNVLAPYTYRGGELMDVAFDHLGIGLGMLASWKWWMSDTDDSTIASRAP